MVKKAKKDEGAVTFTSLDDVLAHLDSESQKEADLRGKLAHQITELTGFKPGQGLDALGVVKVVMAVFDKHYVRRDGK